MWSFLGCPLFDKDNTVKLDFSGYQNKRHLAPKALRDKIRKTNYVGIFEENHHQDKRKLHFKRQKFFDQILFKFDCILYFIIPGMSL